MISPDEKKLLLELLSTSAVFNDKAKIIIRTAVEDGTIPDVDAHYILFVLKNEKNFDAIIERRGQQLITNKQ